MKQFYAKLFTLFVFVISCITSTFSVKAQQSLYNGQVPISVPIHTVDNGRTQVPIRLDYDGSGVKPNVHPGWTGMNWNLSAGGAVTREVKGLPDDHVSVDAIQYGDNYTLKVGYGINSQLETVGVYDISCVAMICVDAIKSFGNNEYENDNTLDNIANWDSKASLIAMSDNMYANNFKKSKLYRDSEPDIFSFHLPNGLSGNFFIKQGGSYEFVIQGNKKFKVRLLMPSATQAFVLPYLVKVPVKPIITQQTGVPPQTGIEQTIPQTGSTEPDRVFQQVRSNPAYEASNGYSHEGLSPSFLGFEVITDDGTIYTFGGTVDAIQYSTSFFGQLTSHWSADSWYLTKITSPDGEVVNFSYNPNVELNALSANPLASNFINSMWLSRNETIGRDCSSCGTEPSSLPFVSNQAMGYFDGALIRPTYLSEISTRSEVIKFEKVPSVELEYDYTIYEKFYDTYYNDPNLKFTWNKPKNISINPFPPNYFEPKRFSWAPYLDRLYDNPTLTTFPRPTNSSIKSIIEQWTKRMTFYKLQAIKVYKKLPSYSTAPSWDWSGLAGLEEMASYKLNYNNDDKVYGTDIFSKRLVLNNLSKENGTKKQTHSFEYESMGAIPDEYLKVNGLVDHWGYFNNIDIASNNFLSNDPQNFLQESRYFTTRKPADLSNSIHALSGILKNIIYPTGGKTAYYFEQNVVNSNRTTRIFNQSPNSTTISGGGLRIKRIEQKDIDNNVINYLDYKYVNNYQDVANRANAFPSGFQYLPIDYLISRNGLEGVIYNYENGKKNNQSSFISTVRTLSIGPPLSSPPVSYNEVAIVQADGTYKILKFSDWVQADGTQLYPDEKINASSRTQVYLSNYITIAEPTIDRSYKRGLITSEESYDFDNKIVSKQNYIFEDITDPTSNYTKAVYRNAILTKSTSNTDYTLIFFRSVASLTTYGWILDAAEIISSAFFNWDLFTYSTATIKTTNFAFAYKVYTHQYDIVKDETFVYDLKDATRTTYTKTINEYKYNQFAPIGSLNEIVTTLPIDQINNTDSKIVQLISKVKYPSDYASGDMSCAAYAIGVYENCPTGQTKDTCDSLRVQAELSCNNAKSEQVKAIDQMRKRNMISTPIESVVSRKVSTTTGSTTSSITKTLSGNLSFYKNYTLNGVITPLFLESYSLANDNNLSDITMSSLQERATFSYSPRYTIKDAKVDIYDSNGNPTKIINRNGIAQNTVYDVHNYPSSQSIQDAPNIGGATVGASAYTFEHLKGLKTSTDDNGKITSYTYDGFNRLKTISDNEGKVLKSYVYNLPFSNPSDVTKADKASDTEKNIGTFAQIEECKPEKSYCDLDAKIKPFDATNSCTNGQIKLEFDATVTTTGTGVKYNWTGPNNFTSSETTPIISQNISNYSGKYTLTVTRDQCTASAVSSTDILIDCNCNFAITTTGTTTNNITCGTDIGGIINLVANCTGCSTELVAGQETYVTNGKFEAGDNSFNSDYPKYLVNNPRTLGDAFRSFGDHTTGTGNMLFLGDSQTPNLRLYYITINGLKPNTRYQVSAWLAGGTDNNPNQMFFEMDGQKLTEDLNFVNSQGGQWKQLKSFWTTSTNQTSVTLAIRKQSTVGWNWIALDDLSLTEAPQPAFYWRGPNNYSSTLQNPIIRNVTAKDGGQYYLTVTDKGCVKSTSVNIAVNCPACTIPITVTASSNNSVSTNGTIKLRATSDDGVKYTWSGKRITDANKSLQNPEIPIDWIVKDGGESLNYWVQAYKDGCADSTYISVNVIKNIIPPNKPGADLAMRIRREDGLTTIEAGETARFCAEINNAGPNNAYDVTFRVQLPSCLELQGLVSNGIADGVSGPEYNFANKQQAWYNTATRELSNMCSENPNQTPPLRDASNCWQYRGAEMGGQWDWNNWNRPSDADLQNFSTHTFTKGMCFNLKATQKSKFIIKGEIMSVRHEGFDDIVDTDSFAGDGFDNDQDDKAELTLNDSYDILNVSKNSYSFGNRTIPVQTFNVSTLRSGWNITVLGNNPSWINVTPIVGSSSDGTLKTTNVSFTVSDNNSTFSRYATIVVKSTCGEEKKINIKQAGSIECPTGLIATVTSPIVCGNTIQLTSTVKAVEEINLIANPDFENGNVGFSSEGWTYYNGTSGTRAYIIHENPKAIMGFTQASCPGTGNESSGLGKMMGVSASWIKSGTFWSQTINVDKGTDYDLSLKAVQLGNYDNTGVILEFFVNGMSTGVKGTISTIGCTWAAIKGKWYSGELFGPVQLSLKLVNSSSGEKMIAIDDLSFKLSSSGRISEEAKVSFEWKGPQADISRLKPASGFISNTQNPMITNAEYKHDGTYTVKATRNGCSTTAEVQVNINCPSNVCVAPSVVMSPANGTICANLNQSVSLSVTGCNGTVFWTDISTNVSDNPRVVTLSSVGSYTYKARCVTSCGMSPESTPVTVIVKDVPVAPVLSVSGNIKICPGGNYNVSATGCSTGTIKWRSNYPSSAVVSGNNYNIIDGTNISSANPITLTVTCEDACGTSTSKTINALIENSLIGVTASGTVDNPRLCKAGGTVTLSGSGCPSNTNYNWYRVEANGTNTNLGTVNPLMVSVTASTNFKVRCEQQTCQSAFSSNVSVNVRTSEPPAPSTPTLNSGQSAVICKGTSISINASACPEAGNTLVWSTGATNVSSIMWSSTQAGTFNVSVKCMSDIGCQSASSSNLTITVTADPLAPTLPCLSQDPGCQTATICKNTSLTIYGGACTTGLNSAWYSSPDNITFTKMSGYTSSNIIVSPTNNTYYKVACESSCGIGEFANRIVNVNVIEKPVTQNIVSPATDMTSPSCNTISLYALKDACSGANFSFQWYKDGTIIPGETQWNYNATMSGRYKVKCINNNNPVDCREGNESAERVISIETSPLKPTISQAVACTSVTLTSSNCGAGQTYKWYKTDDVIAGAITNSYVVSISGTYSVKCVNNSNTFCKESDRSDAAIVTINTLPTAPSISSNQSSICSGGTVTLTATGCTGTVKWSNNGTGASITPTLSTNTTFTATCTNASGCTSGNSNSTTVTIVASPTAPTISSSLSSVCSGGTVTLTATGCTGTVKWSNNGTGTSITPTISTNTTFTATCTNASGCVSGNSNSTTVTIATPPAAPTISSSQSSVCPGGTVTLTATGCTGTVKWSNNSTGASITPTVSTNTTFTATCTNTSGCISANSNSTTVTVNTLPAAPVISSSRSSVCAGSPVTLTATGCTGTVKWSNNSTGTSITPTVSANTTFTATCTNSSGCMSGNSNSVTVVADPVPVLYGGATRINNGSWEAIYPGTYVFPWSAGVPTSMYLNFGGGTPPFEVRWSFTGMPDITEAITSTTGGTYRSQVNFGTLCETNTGVASFKVSNSEECEITLYAFNLSISGNCSSGGNITSIPKTNAVLKQDIGSNKVVNDSLKINNLSSPNLKKVIKKGN